MSPENKIQLYGFNNLTKSLSFSLYKLHYIPALNTDNIKQYNHYINTTFSANNLTQLLNNLSDAIGGNILNIAKQEYSPQGASVTMMISEEAQTESVVSHLDKSHLCVHTYPEDNLTNNNVVIFRADIELSTCGLISPLKIINYVIKYFKADLVDIDYRIRGMTRDKTGKKHYIDESVDRISDKLNHDTKALYLITDDNLSTRQLYFCRLARKKMVHDDFIFENTQSSQSLINKQKIEQAFFSEMSDLTSV